MAGLEVDDPDDKAKADTFILTQILDVYYVEAEHVLACLGDVADEVGQGPREVLVKRWAQIRVLITEAARNGINATDGARFLEGTERSSVL